MTRPPFAGGPSQSGDQALGLCIFRYDGAVHLGIASDATLLPDPDLLGQHIDEAVHRLAASRR